MGRTNRILTGSVLNAHPFDNLPEEAWSELTDPVSFVVGSMLILFYRAKRVPDQSAPFDPVAVGGRIGATLGATPWVVMPVLIPVLVGLLFPQFGVGNSFWYAMTLLVAGAFTVVPSRLADLRDRKRVRGAGYPKTLRKVMWWIEVCIWFGAIVAIFVWNFGGAKDHSIVRAVVWGLLAVSLTEFATLSAARSIAIAETPDGTSGAEGQAAAADVGAAPQPGA